MGCGLLRVREEKRESDSSGERGKWSRENRNGEEKIEKIKKKGGGQWWCERPKETGH